METIDIPKRYSNAEIAKILGCSEENIRINKSKHSEELVEGVDWEREGQATRWSDEGVKKLTGWIKTDEAIALRNEIIKAETTEVKPHETEIKAENIGNPLDRYADLPNVLGDAIANRLVDDGILERTDSVVVRKLTKAMMNRKPQLDVSVAEAFSLLDAIAS